MTGVDAAAQTAIASVIAALIAGTVAILTQRSASQAAVRNARVTSMADLEKEAGERAARIYQGAIDTLEHEQQEDRAEIAQLKGRVAALEAELADTRSELDLAKRALRIRYPDEE